MRPGDGAYTDDTRIPVDAARVALLAGTTTGRGTVVVVAAVVVVVVADDCPPEFVVVVTVVVGTTVVDVVVVAAATVTRAVFHVVQLEDDSVTRYVTDVDAPTKPVFGVNINSPVDAFVVQIPSPLIDTELLQTRSAGSTTHVADRVNDVYVCAFIESCGAGVSVTA